MPDNPAIKDRIRGYFSTPADHPFDILQLIGMDSVGAIQFIEIKSEYLDCIC